MSFDFGSLGETYVSIVAKHGDLDTYLNRLPQIAGSASEKAAGRMYFLRQEFQRQKDLLDKLVTSLGGVQAAAGNAFVGFRAARLNELGDQLARATRETQSFGRGGRNMGFAALELSRGLEDLQYGIGGVINNIPGLVMALGGGAGLTAAISVAAVAINQLVKNWGQWIGDLNPSGIKTITEQIADLKAKVKDLEDKPHKIALDIRDLDLAKDKLEQLQKLEAAIKGQKETPTDAEAAQATAVKKAITESPQGRVAQALLDTGYAGLNADPAVKAALANFEKATAAKHADHTVIDPESGLVDRAMTEMAKERADRDFRKARDNLMAARRTAADQALGRAEGNRGDLDALIGHMQANPADFRDILPRLLNATAYRPDVVKGQSDAIDEMTRAWKFEEDQRSEHASKQAEIIDEMTAAWHREDEAAKQHQQHLQGNADAQAEFNRRNSAVDNPGAAPKGAAPVGSVAEEAAKRANAARRAVPRAQAFPEGDRNAGFGNLDRPAEGRPAINAEAVGEPIRVMLKDWGDDLGRMLGLGEKAGGKDATDRLDKIARESEKQTTLLSRLVDRPANEAVF